MTLLRTPFPPFSSEILHFKDLYFMAKFDISISFVVVNYYTIKHQTLGCTKLLK